MNNQHLVLMTTSLSTQYLRTLFKHDEHKYLHFDILIT